MVVKSSAMIEFRKFDETTLEDACSVVARVFRKETCALIKMGLRNPAKELLAEVGSGEVVYEDGAPVGFHAAFPRRMVYKNRLFVYISGSTMCVLPTAKTMLLAVKILEKTQVASRAGSVLFVGNTINANRMNLNRILRSKYQGPRQCAEKRLMRVGWLRFYWYMFVTKVLKRSSGALWRGRPCKLDHAKVNDFWQRYLKTNKGVTASRTAAELEWLFGDRLAGGRATLVELAENGVMAGYAVLSASRDGKRWRVLDVIVLENDLRRLDRLFGNIREFLKNTPAVACQISGFCDAAQPVIARAFPVCRPLENNKYFIHFQKEDAAIPIDRLNNLDSWLFGPYEGDAAML